MECVVVECSCVVVVVVVVVASGQLAPHPQL